MSVQRKLNALLFELQTAQSPLAQAKILARSWRTLRELSPTDRRLLARHAGFEGAEQILEGLAGRKMGFAPATLLQVLNKARTTDGAAVTDLLAAVRDPSRLDEAVIRGAGLAQELLGETTGENGPQEIDEALDQLQSVEQGDSEPPVEAAALLDENRSETPKPQAPPQPAPPVDVGTTEPVAASNRRRSTEKPGPRPSSARPPSHSPPKVPPAAERTAPKAVVPLEGWKHLGDPREPIQHESEPAPAVETLSVTPGSSRFDTLAVFAALEAESSSLARLRALEREMGGVKGAGLANIRKLVDSFPDGWARRRAVVALISAGTLVSASQALKLIAGLEREIDRRWCLGALAQRGDLQGDALEESLDLVASPAGRRRLQNIAARR